MEYKDYYKILGINKNASQEEISKAYKKMARKYHPDLNPDNDQAEAKFKEVNEAHEVLKDAEKRKMYDTLGPNWKDGQNFQPPPGYENMNFNFQGGSANFEGSGFSDFFETIFGGFGGGGFEGAQFGGRSMSSKGQDAEVALELSLKEAYLGGKKSLNLQERVTGPGGMPQMRNKTLQVNIPAGVKEGAKIRLAGQGNPGRGGGPAGDLYLKVRIAPHSRFKLEDNNIIFDLALSPWEAALGAKVNIPTLDSSVDMNIPAGVSSGQKLRIKDKGLGRGAKKGDQLVRIMIRTPKNLNSEQEQLWKQLAQISNFNPRD